MNKRRMLLAWEQGTGKTVISLAAAEKLFELGKAKNVLVLCPSSIAWQWEDKIKQFTDTSVVLATRKDSDSRTYRLGRCGGYYICPYSLFRRDFTTIFSRNWDIVIADEAQEFRSYTSKTLKLMLKLRTTYRWALTGTAIGNKLEELYNLYRWIDPKFLPIWPTFEEAHIVRNEFGLIWKYKNLNALNKHLQARMDRKTQADLAGQLPTLVTQVHKLSGSTAFYKAQNELLADLDDMAGTLHFDEEGNLKVQPNSKVAKAFARAREQLLQSKQSFCLDKIREILAENANNKLVLFCSFKQPLYNLYEQLGSEAVFFTGDQTADEKRDNIRRFRDSNVGGPRVLLASNAGKAGLDLPFANYAIHLDIHPSWEVTDQRTKRIVRATGDSNAGRTCVVLYIVIEDSFDEYFFDTVLAKGRLAKAVKEGGEDEVVVKTTSMRRHIRGEDEPRDISIPPADKAKKTPRRKTVKSKTATTKPVSSRRTPTGRIQSKRPGPKKKP